MIDNATEIAKLFSEHVVNIVKRLGLITNKQSAENSLSEVEIAIAKERNHPSRNQLLRKLKILGTLHLALISLRMRKQ